MDRTTGAPLRCSLAMAMAMAFVAMPTQAIDIIINLEDFGDNPDFDSDGSELQRIANAAAQIWERLLPGSGTYTVDIWWEPIESLEPGSTTLGIHNIDFVGNNNIRINPNSDSGWFIDETPLNHSEFDFSNDPSGPPAQEGRPGTTLFRELNTAQRADWFIGTATGTLETGYIGSGISDAVGSRNDLLSTVVHELGHELGVSDEFDGEYEIDSALLGGAGGLIAIQDDESGHMAARAAPLMCRGCGASGVRRLPSALDVLAIAGNEGYTSVDLERKYFIQGLNKTDWNSNLSWVGGRVPDGADDAFLYHGDTVLLSGDAHANNLALADGSDLATRSHELLVDKLVRIATGSRITVDADGRASVGTLQIEGGSLSLAGGTAVVGTTTNDGTVSGRGVMQVDDAFSNNGSLLPTNGTLAIIGPGSIDLDGDANAGVVNAIVGDLVIAAPIAGTFSGTMRIGAGRLASLGDWTLFHGGRLTLDGSTSEAATLNSPAGGTFNALGGDIVVNGLGIIATTNAQFFRDTGVSLTNSNDVLFLNSAGVTNFRGAGFSGFGELQQGGDVQVLADTALEVGRFDWGNNHDLVLQASDLSVNAADSGEAGNPYHGAMTLNGGRLTVNFDGGWSLPTSLRGARSGSLLLRNMGTGTPTIAGEHLTIDSFVEVVGGVSRIEADLTTTQNADIFVHAGGHLELSGNTVFNGGFFNTDAGGTGTIAQHGDIVVGNDVFLDVATYDWGNSVNVLGNARLNQTIIVPGVLFAVRAAGTGTSDNAYHGVFNIAGGTLHTEFDSAWTLPAEVTTLPVSRLRGQINFNHVQIGNFGDIVSGITGQALRIGGDVSVQGHLANENRANIAADVEFLPSARVEVGLNGVLALLGNTTFAGGEYGGVGTISQGADFTFVADTTISASRFDWGNSAGLDIHKLTVASGARLTVDSFILGDPDNSFRGVVDLRGGHLDINSTAPWSLPADSLLTRGGILNLFGGNRGAPPPTLSGQALNVGGTVNIATLGVLDAAVSFLDSSELNFIADGTLEFGSKLEWNDVIIDHGDHAGRIRGRDTGALQWGLGANVIARGDSGGSLDFMLDASTTVELSAAFTPSLTIDTGATVNVDGAIDPFTSSSDPQAHVSVINRSNGSLNIRRPQVRVTELSGNGDTHVASGAALSATAIGQNQLMNEGVLTLRSTGTSIDTNVLVNLGTISLSGGTIITGSVIQNGTIDIPEGADLRFEGAVTGSGNYSGGGAVEFGGTFAPGESPAAIEFAGDVFFDSTAVLDIEIGGAGSAEYDTLQVAGALLLAGTLNVSLIDDFALAYVPALGDSFQLFKAGIIVGDFDAVMLPTLDNGEWRISNDGASYSLAVSAVPLPSGMCLLLSALPVLLRTRLRNAQS